MAIVVWYSVGVVLLLGCVAACAILHILAARLMGSANDPNSPSGLTPRVNLLEDIDECNFDKFGLPDSDTDSD